MAGLAHALAIAEIDAAIARLQAAKEELSTEENASPWMTIASYAAHAGVHPDTVRKYIMDGMPAADVKKDRTGKVVGTNKTTRIHRVDADAWRSKR